MYIIRKRLSETEGQNPGQRYNPDCDCIQVTPDGGVTWVNDPSADPRTNIVYLLPPNTEPDPQCAGAAGMVAYVRASVDLAIDTATVIGLANGIFAIVVAFLPITILAAVILAIAEYLIGLGAAALIAAFSEGTYDSLLCIFYNNSEADGSITESGFSAAQGEIAAEIGDIVVDGVIAALYSSTGFVGWSNAGARLADGEAECEDCFCFEPGCFEWNFSATTSEQNWISDPATWTPGFEGGIFQQVCEGGIGSNSILRIYQEFPITPEILHCEVHLVEFDAQVVGVTTDWTIEYFNDVGAWVGLLSGSAGAGGSTSIGGVCTSVDCYGLRVSCVTDSGCGTGDVYLHAVRIESDDLCGIDQVPNC